MLISVEGRDQQEGVLLSCFRRPIDILQGVSGPGDQERDFMLAFPILPNPIHAQLHLLITRLLYFLYCKDANSLL